MMGGVRKVGPTQQGPNAAGTGNRHARPPEDAPGPWSTGEAPFHPKGGEPAPDPEAMAEEVLARSRTGRAAEGDAGPEATGKGGR